MRDTLAAIAWRQLAIDLLLFVLLTPFWLAGWVAGFVWAIIIYTSAAVVAGFREGAGHGTNGT